MTKVVRASIKSINTRINTATAYYHYLLAITGLKPENIIYKSLEEYGFEVVARPISHK